jgi:Family of unknown function (DUF6011)
MQSVDRLREHLADLAEGDRSFAESLLDQAHRRGLSSKQLDWVNKLIERATRPPMATATLTGIVEFMQNAALIVERPRLLLRAGEAEIRLAIAGPRTRTPGMINVTSADRYYEDRVFYGRIGHDGVFAPSLKADPSVMAAVIDCLKLLDSDPAEAASRYGRLTGHCSFCHLPLTDVRSLAVGYGMICARKYGLPYGGKP